jgi:hypothetical protein
MRIVHIYLSSMVPTAFRFTGSCTLLFYSPPLPLCLSDCPFHPQSKGLRKADGVFESNYIHSPSSVISRSLSEVPIYPIPSHHPESSHPTQQPLHPNIGVRAPSRASVPPSSQQHRRKETSSYSQSLNSTHELSILSILYQSIYHTN